MNLQIFRRENNANAGRESARMGTVLFAGTGTVPVFVLFIILSLPLAADQPRFSGIVESNGYIQNDTDGENSWYMEEYANLRMKADIHDKAVIYGAVNASALSSDSQELATSGELERLYMSVRAERADIDAGLMRIAFGYGQAFRPTDIFNPPNPLYPDARPKGALGSVVSFYPRNDWKLQLFGADRTQPYVQYDGKTRPLAGTSGEIHTPNFSTQGLYAVQSSSERHDSYIHYTGLSLKFDVVIGVALDGLYTYRQEDESFLRGFEYAIGGDYSFFDGDLYFLGQYFYNGDGSLSSGDDISDLYGTESWKELPVEERYPLTGYSDFYRRHYLYFSGTWSFDDYTRLTPSILTALEDTSLQMALEAEYEPFQGMILSLTLRAPLDRRSLGRGRDGELGPEHSGYTNSVKGQASLRF